MRRSGTALLRLVTLALSAILVGGIAGSIAAAASPSSSTRSSLFQGGTNHASKGVKRGTVNVSKLPKDGKGSGRSTTQLNLPLPKTPGSDGTGRSATPTSGAPAPVEATRNLLATHPHVDQTGFAGLSRLSGPNTNTEPPDPYVAAGPDHIVQTTNASIRITNRTGGAAISYDLFDFFSLPASFENTGPRVMYDSAHGRWLATEVSWDCQDDFDTLPYAYVDLLVSRTADPNGLWDLWFWEYQGHLPDFASLGWSSITLGVGANLFTMPTGYNSGCMSQAGSTYEGSALFAFDWADVLSDGGVNGYLDTYDPGTSPTSYITPRFAQQTPATSSMLQGVVQHAGVSAFQPYYFALNGSVLAHTIGAVIEGDLTNPGIVAAWVEPPDPQQPGPDTVTTAIDSRPTDAIWQNNRLIFVSNYGCTPATDSTIRDCVRITELNTAGVNTTTLPTLTQDYLITEVGKDNYYGGVGIALDGTVHAVWTRSATTAGDYPSSIAAYQLPSDAANTISPNEALHAGAGVYTGTRWGDYVGVAQDPQVPNAVWQGNQYAAGGANWATYVSQLQTGGSRYVPITPLRVVDSRINLGVTGVFASNVPKTFNVAGAGTISAAAVAVTGNVTVVNQTAAGYVSVTPNPTATPPSSTINFPLGDVRANNFTIPLNGSGDLAAVYKAVAGRQAHVIVDITGYFVTSTGATYSTISPTRALDTRPGPSHVGPLNTFAAAVTQTVSVAGDVAGVPANATAITGNLTVVGQTKAGYLSVTPDDPPGTPGSSTLNFPLGDVRANGLTADLNGSGDLSITYTAVAGGTANVILDITGYYVDDTSGLSFYPLTPGRIMDSRPGAVLSGVSGAFSSSVPKALDTDGHWGVPAGAQAITGNLTVVGQTAAGFVSDTPTSVANPTTSTLNFPLGDIRANGITVLLGIGPDLGNQYLVYKATAGKTTNLLLDLSGYFK